MIEWMTFEGKWRAGERWILNLIRAFNIRRGKFE
jgi:hypothetical protein